MDRPRTITGGVISLYILFSLLVAVSSAGRSPSFRPTSGICESAVRIHGYECQEFHIPKQNTTKIDLMLWNELGKNCCLNASTVEVFLRSEPQSTSTKNLVHMAQTVRDGIVRKYDYGNSNFNMEHYGVSKPPIYDLGNIPRDLPIFLSYGGQDALSDVKDVQTLLDSLRLHDVGKLHVQYIKEYAHADFIMGVAARDILYHQIVSFFRTNN